MKKFDKALAAEIEGTRQELKSDPEGFERGLRRYRRRSWLLSRRFLLPMRRGLTDEADIVFLEGWTEPINRVVDMLFSPDGDLSSPPAAAAEHMEGLVPKPQKGPMPAALMPSDNEVHTAAMELAQLLLSNWIGFISFQADDGQREAMVALHATPPRLPPEVTEGCAAYPVAEEDCIAILVGFLLEDDPPVNDDDATLPP